jgi:hypothetical protein
VDSSETLVSTILHGVTFQKTVISIFTDVRKSDLMYKYVGFEILTAVVMKSTISWDITPCCPLKFNRRFGVAYRLIFKVEEKAERAISLKAGGK